MIKKLLILLLAMLFISSAYGQIVVVLDNTDPCFSITGTWKTKTDDDCYLGSAVYKNKGDGSAWARWREALKIPGHYKLEFYTMDYKFGKDTEWTVQQASGDTLVYGNMYYNPGWVELGDFVFGDSVNIRLGDYFASDSGSYVFADAIRLTSVMPTFKISGDIVLNGLNTSGDVTVNLYKVGSSEALFTNVSHDGDRNYMFTNIPAGYYRLEASAVGYQDIVIDSLEIADQDIIDDLTFSPVSDPLYSISGLVKYTDNNADLFTKILLTSAVGNNLVAVDSAKHNCSYIFSGIPAGMYQLTFSVKDYSDVVMDLVVSDSDIQMEDAVMYPYFNIAWITDSHVGYSLGTTQLPKVISDINNCDEPLDFVFHTGDITEHGYNSELQTAFDIMDNSNIPVYVCPGNHDTKWSESGLSKFEEIYGDLFFSFDHKGFHLVSLNNAITLRGAGGFFNPVQYEWLKNDLESMADPNMPVVVFYHIPSTPSSVPNHWRITNILKDYRVLVIVTGHGHSNRIYDFDGLPGIMAMDTYSDVGGFSMLSISEKEVKVTPYYRGVGFGDSWYAKACPDSVETIMTFANMEQSENINQAKTLSISVSETATGGSYSIEPDSKSGSMSQNGDSWEVVLDPASLNNGYHEIEITLNLASGGSVYKTLGFYTENGDYPKAVWRFDAQDEILSKPAWDGTNIYIGTGQGKFYALNAETGALQWIKEDCDGHIYSSPETTGELVVFGTSNGVLYGLNSRTGAVVWEYNSGGSIHSGITIVDSLVYFGSRTSLKAYNMNQQDLQWSFGTGGMVESKPAVSGDKIVCTSWNTNVNCLNRFTGQKNWTWSYQSSMYYSPGAGWPVIINNKVFVVDPKKNMSCLSLEDGSLLWQSDSPNTWDSIGSNEKKTQVYIRSLDGNMYAFEPVSSRVQLWSCAAGFGWDAQPSMPAGKQGGVFAGGKSGNLIKVNQDDGSLTWSYHTSGALVNSVTPKNGVSAFVSCLDGTVAYIEGDPALVTAEKIMLGYENLLLPPYPNPFNNQTTIKYTLAKKQVVSIRVYDLLGNLVFSKNMSAPSAGEYSCLWTAKNGSGKSLASGVYIVHLRGESFHQHKKMLFLK